MNKLEIILRTWKFLYRYQKYGNFVGRCPHCRRTISAITALISKEIINSILAPGHNLIAWLPNAFLFAIAYGAVTLLQGVISSYAAIELVTIKDRTAAVTDQLLMKQAAGSYDITAYEVPETRDQLRLASVGWQRFANLLHRKCRSPAAPGYGDRDYRLFLFIIIPWWRRLSFFRRYLSFTRK